MMKRCVVKLDDKKASKKVERLNAISLSAAKQSKRGIIPEVKSVMTMKQACEYAANMDLLLLHLKILLCFHFHLLIQIQNQLPIQ